MNRRDFLLSSAAFLLTTQTLLSTSLPVQASGSEVVIVLSSDETGAPHLDPIRATLLSVAADLIYDRLIAMSDQHTFHPHLAESWQESEDGLNWTFRLKKNVRFHDGSPLTPTRLSGGWQNMLTVRTSMSAEQLKKLSSLTSIQFALR